MKRLGHIALMTRAKGPMIAYYRDFLGLRLVYDNDHSTMLRLTEAEHDCGLVLIEHTEAPAGPLGHYHHLGFNVADRAEMGDYIARARALGLPCQGPFEDPYIGYYAFFQDPDGNNVELSTPEGVNAY